MPNKTRTFFQVTKIAAQKKDPTRKSIFLNGKYAFGISPETLLKFPLSVGQKISNRQLWILKFHEEYQQGKRKALKYLGRRLRSEKELRTYLKRKQISPRNSDRIINYCLKEKYLDDVDFTRAFINDQLNLNRAGINKIRMKLFQRGIDHNLIEQQLNALTDSDQQVAVALRIARKKLALIRQDPQKKRDKLYRYLKGKGFTTPVIYQVLQEVL